MITSNNRQSSIRSADKISMGNSPNRTLLAEHPREMTLASPDAISECISACSDNMSATTMAGPASLIRSRRGPYKRCRCGVCRECLDNAKWDERFAKYEVKNDWNERGIFGSTLNGQFGRNP